MAAGTIRQPGSRSATTPRRSSRRSCAATCRRRTKRSTASSTVAGTCPASMHHRRCGTTTADRAVGLGVRTDTSDVDSDVGEISFWRFRSPQRALTTGVLVVAHFPEPGSRRDPRRGPGPDDRRARRARRLGGTRLVDGRPRAATRPGVDRDGARISETDLSQRIPVPATTRSPSWPRPSTRCSSGSSGFGTSASSSTTSATSCEPRSPSCRGHLELLGDDPDERAETIATVLDELDRMNRYVNELILLAKAESRDFLRSARSTSASSPRTLETALSSRWRATGRGSSTRPRPARWRCSPTATGSPRRCSTSRQRRPAHRVGRHDRHRHRTVDRRRRGSGCATPDPASRTTRRSTSLHRASERAASRVRRTEGMGLGLSIVDAIATSPRRPRRRVDEPGGGRAIHHRTPTRRRTRRRTLP